MDVGQIRVEIAKLASLCKSSSSVLQLVGHKALKIVQCTFRSIQVDQVRSIGTARVPPHERHVTRYFALCLEIEDPSCHDNDGPNGSPSKYLARSIWKDLDSQT